MVHVIGSMSVDLVVQSNRLPKKSETILGEFFFMTEGGKGVNQGAGLSVGGLGVQGCMPYRNEIE